MVEQKLPKLPATADSVASTEQNTPRKCRLDSNGWLFAAKQNWSGEAVMAIHFVGFRGDEYASAVRVWGKPDFIHRGWDRRSRREIDPDTDTVVFARGPHNQPYSDRNFDDIKEAQA